MDSVNALKAHDDKFTVQILSATVSAENESYMMAYFTLCLNKAIFKHRSISQGSVVTFLRCDVILSKH